ncbi:hypothetical protein KKI23_04315 [Patescibacteria group bacterium]|nr:hypothetical protein [Patescibacteria group bacterium]
MLLNTHALAGILIGQKLGNPIWAFFLGIISHYLLDAIPHGDEQIGKWVDQRNQKARTVIVVLSDLLVLLTFSLLIIWQVKSLNLISIIAGMIGAVLPDFLVYVIGPPGNSLFKSLHTRERTGVLRTLLSRHSDVHENKTHNPLKFSIPVGVGLCFHLILNLVFFYLLIS